jgi:hypothetical protein
MKKTNGGCLLTYVYYIALFSLTYLLFRFIQNNYNKFKNIENIENFTGGLPTMTGNKSGNIAAWISIIVVGFGLFSFVFYIVFKNVKEKRSIDKAATNLYKELSKTWSD